MCRDYSKRVKLGALLDGVKRGESSVLHFGCQFCCVVRNYSEVGMELCLEWCVASRAGTDDWATPPVGLRGAGRRVPVSTSTRSCFDATCNAKCPRFFTAADDGLAQELVRHRLAQPALRAPRRRHRRLDGEGARVGLGRRDRRLPRPRAAPTPAGGTSRAMRASEVRLVRGRLCFGAGAAIPRHSPRPSSSSDPGDHGPPRFSAVSARDLTSGQMTAVADHSSSSRGRRRGQMLRKLPDASVHCCVTSPPYFGRSSRFRGLRCRRTPLCS